MEKYVGYTVLIEREDGSTYPQYCKEFEDVLDLADFMDEKYRIVQIY